jgi:hypothetical protein
MQAFEKAEDLLVIGRRDANAIVPNHVFGWLSGWRGLVNALHGRRRLSRLEL